MKKSVFFAALAAVVLAGCAKNETYVKVANQDEVNFGAYSGRTITKAGSTDDMNLDALKDHGFGVFATYSGTDNYTTATNDFMYNQEVRWYDADNNGTTDWEYAPVKYWPNPTNGQTATAQRVSFFAYAPYANPSTDPTAPETAGITEFSIDTNTGHNLVHYAFSNDKAQPNVDLMWGYKNGWDKVSATDADRVNINLSRPDNADDKISFKFQHVLSKLGGSQEGTITDPTADGYVANGLIIKANAETIAPTNNFGTPNGTKITVSSIIVESAPATAVDATVKDSANGEVVYSDSQKGTLDLYTGEFKLSGDANPVQFKQTITNKIDDPATTPFDESKPDSELAAIIAEPSASDFNNDFSNLPTGVTSKAVNVYKDESSPIILVPGTRPVVDVTITYTVRTYDAKLPSKFTDVKQTVFGRIKFPLIEKNKKYNLLMILGLNDVKFEATVEDWTAVGQTWNDLNNDGKVDDGELTGTQVELGLPDNL